MPLPLILGGIAAVAGLSGIGAGISGGVKMKQANDTKEAAQRIARQAESRLKQSETETMEVMEALGKLELEIMASFDSFSDLIEKIQNRPKFEPVKREKFLAEFNLEELRQVSIGANVLLGGLSGAAAGTAGGFAAAGAAASAVMALGTASTGTAIASLSGAAAVNATLAALGGGALAAGGGGMALGAAVLGSATLGIGLFVGGIIFNRTGSKLSDKADEAMTQAREIERQVDEICVYLTELKETASGYKDKLESVKTQYDYRLNKLREIVDVNGKYDWKHFTRQEKKLTQNLVLLVDMLYKMCKIKLVEKISDTKKEVRSAEARSLMSEADIVLANVNKTSPIARTINSILNRIKSILAKKFLFWQHLPFVRKRH